MNNKLYKCGRWAAQQNVMGRVLDTRDLDRGASVMNSSRIVGGFIVYVNEKHSLRSKFININVLRVRF
jgi:hypothetical protein